MYPHALRTLSLAFLLLIFVSSAQALDINSCTTLDQNNVTYHLTADISSATSPCLQIIGVGVELDGNNHTLTKTGGVSGVGVLVLNTSDTNVHTITVTGYAAGVSYSASSNGRLFDSNISGNLLYGVSIDSSTIIDLNNNVIQYNAKGVLLDGSIYNSITFNTITQNGAYGVQIHDATSPTDVTDNNLSDNGSFPVFISGGSIGACFADMNRNVMSGGDFNFFGPLSVAASDLNAAFVFVCGADGFTLTDANITPTNSPQMGGLFIYKTKNSLFLDINVNYTSKGMTADDVNDSNFVLIRSEHNTLNAASGLHINGNNNWVTEGVFSSNNDNGLTILGTNNFVQYTITQDNNYDGMYIQGAENGVFDIIATGNGTNGISIGSDGGTVTYSNLTGNGGVGLYVFDSTDGNYLGNTCYYNGTNGIYLYNSTRLTVSGNNLTGITDYPSLYAYLNHSLTILDNHILDTNSAVYLEADFNSRVAGNLIGDTNTSGSGGIYVADSNATTLFQNQLEGTKPTAITLVDSNDLVVQSNTINMFGGDAITNGIRLIDVNASSILSNLSNQVDTHLYLLNSSDNNINSNTFFNGVTSWLVMTGILGDSANNTFARTSFVDTNHGSFRVDSPMTVTGGFNIVAAAFTFADNNAIVNLTTDALVFQGLNATIELINEGILTDINAYHNGVLCGITCSSVTTTEEGVYDFNTALPTSSIHSYSLAGVDANALILTISSPTNGTTVHSSTVTLDFNAVGVYDFLYATQFFTSTDGVSWVNNGTDTNKSFTGQADGTHTYYVLAQDSSDNNSNIASVTVTIDTSSGSTSGTSIGGSPAGTSTHDWNTVLTTKDTHDVTLSLKENQNMQFTIGGTNHTIGVLDINTTTVTIQVASTPQTAYLKDNETKEFDLDGDANNDIMITLSSHTASTAQLQIHFLAKTTPSSTGAGTTTPSQSGTTLPPRQSPSTPAQEFPLIPAIIVVILIVALVMYVTKKKK